MSAAINGVRTRIPSRAVERFVDALVAHDCRPRQSGRSWSARCPAHDDRSPSLSITPIEGTFLLCCHAGCSNDEILAAVGIDRSAFYDDPRGARYPYGTTAGTTRSVTRSPDKTFSQQGDTRSTPLLFHVERVLEAVAAGRPVYVVEGEKDVLTAEALGAVATTSPMGAESWHKCDSTALHGGHVIVVPDQDEKGSRYLEAIAASLAGHVESLRVLKPAHGKDLSDHVAAGGTLDDLEPGELPVAEVDRPSRFDRAVTAEADRLRVRDAAARVVRQEHAAPEPGFVRLGTFLAVPDPPITYRIESLLPVGGRVICAAQFKAGKTTLRDNLVRALVDDEPFLDRFAVNAPPGRVVLLDDELDERMLRRWLRAHGIVNVDKVTVLPLRGKVGTFDLLDPDCRTRWASKLREEDAGFVILDCLRPVLDALNLSEDKDGGRFLVAFEALLEEAGIGEAVVNHHAGHTGERSRGDSRFRDWPDVEWKLVREQTDEGDQAADARRYFSAYGRDVDVAEGLLTYESATRRLSLAGGSRRDTAADAVIPDVLAFLREHPGSSGRAIESALTGAGGHPQKRVREAIHRATGSFVVETRAGAHGASMHYVTGHKVPSASSASVVRQRGRVSASVRPIDDALTHAVDTVPSASATRTPSDGDDPTEQQSLSIQPTLRPADTTRSPE